MIYTISTFYNHYNKYSPETHLNLFARNPENESIVCFNPKCCKYISEERKQELKKVGSQKQREYTIEYINEFIETAKENGYIVAYNHPYWSLETAEYIHGINGCFSMEMVNYGCYVSNGLEYNGQIYDSLLMAGKRIFCHSADDNHNGAPLDSVYSDSFGGITMILAENLEYGEIFSAMEKGEMYSTMGPTFKEVSFDGEKLHIECSDVQSIYVYYGSKAPSRIHAPKGETVNCADITVDKNCKYIRVSIADKYGNRADTRGFFRDELGL